MKEKKNNKTVKRNLKTKHLRMLVFSPYNYFIKEYNFKKKTLQCLIHFLKTV